MEELLKTVPKWLIALVGLAFVVILIERIYVSEKPIRLFGKDFGPIVQTPASNVSRSDLATLADAVTSQQTRVEALDDEFKSFETQSNADRRSIASDLQRLKQQMVSLEEKVAKLNVRSKVPEANPKPPSLSKFHFGITVPAYTKREGNELFFSVLSNGDVVGSVRGGADRWPPGTKRNFTIDLGDSPLPVSACKQLEFRITSRLPEVVLLDFTVKGETLKGKLLVLLQLSEPYEFKRQNRKKTWRISQLHCDRLANL